MDGTFYSAAGVAMQVDEEVVRLLFILFEVVARFESESCFVFGFEVDSGDRVPL